MVRESLPACRLGSVAEIFGEDDFFAQLWLIKQLVKM